MRYLYRIYHDEAGKDRVDKALHPFSTERQLHEYSCFPTALALRLEPGIEYRCIAADNPLDGVIVDFDSTLSEDEIDSRLAECLVSLNKQISGLCLIIQKL